MSKVFVVGIGPGGLDEMTPRARRAIESVEVVAGYNTYIKLIENIISDKKIIGRAMMQEVERCQLAIAEALSGRNVAVVSSGDAGVYGMAGLVLEMILDLPKDKLVLPLFPGDNRFFVFTLSYKLMHFAH